MLTVDLPLLATCMQPHGLNNIAMQMPCADPVDIVLDAFWVFVTCFKASQLSSGANESCMSINRRYS